MSEFHAHKLRYTGRQGIELSVRTKLFSRPAPNGQDSDGVSHLWGQRRQSVSGRFANSFARNSRLSAELWGVGMRKCAECNRAGRYRRRPTSEPSGVPGVTSNQEWTSHPSDVPGLARSTAPPERWSFQKRPRRASLRAPSRVRTEAASGTDHPPSAPELVQIPA